MIRDRIPEIIQAAGKHCETTVMDDEEYIQALRLKLVEEAQEALQSAPNDLLIELADLQEVIIAIMSIYGITQDRA